VLRNGILLLDFLKRLETAAENAIMQVFPRHPEELCVG
jgi:hypothetical protein